MADVFRCSDARAVGGRLAPRGRGGGALVPVLRLLLAAVLLLLWENLSNDLFDADTGVDVVGKPHSIVALVGQRRPVRRWACWR